ncbi:MAG: hypothetical protein Ta2F_11960 [Termitinemataceae bacterium]|nr:MAG: hypothetical protein Ta2F_11960 [Termitinemataceae bacterium]
MSNKNKFSSYQKSVPTKMPDNLTPTNKRKKEFSGMLQGFGMDYVKRLYKAFIGGSLSSKPLKELIDNVSSAMCWENCEEFDAWITKYTPDVQKIIYTLVLYEVYPEELLRTSKEIPLCIVEKRSWYDKRVEIDQSLNLNFVFARLEKDNVQMFIPPFLKSAIGPWFEIPKDYSFDSCAEKTEPDQKDIYNNEKEIIESMPLLSEAAIKLKKDVGNWYEEEKLIGGLGKKQITDLLKQTGFKRFSDTIEYAPFAEDLAIRFFLCMTSKDTSKITDTYDDIKKLVYSFFSRDILNTKAAMRMSGFLESNVLTDHLLKKITLYYSNEPPNSRNVFFNTMYQIAKDGRWFDAEKLSLNTHFNTKTFGFINDHYERRTGIIAKSIKIDDIIYTEEYSDLFAIDGGFRLELLIKPLFKAYCYLFAALGILEITQKQPENRCVTKKDKNIPLSIYDSLSLIRVTEFGKWCIGVNQNKPVVAKNKFEAIADKELLLITVKGNSLALTLLLDKIGVKLGNNRWRVSCSSFLRDCIKKEDIIERIDAFRNLIDKNPSFVWENLFNKTLSYCGYFSQHTVDGFIFSLDAKDGIDKAEHQKIIEAILKDPRLKGTAFRAENKMLVVPAKQKNSFLQILSDHGILDNFA